MSFSSWIWQIKVYYYISIADLDIMLKIHDIFGGTLAMGLSQEGTT